MWNPPDLPLSLLRERVEDDQQSARRTFAEQRDGMAIVRGRPAHVDTVIRELWSAVLAEGSLPVALFAIGGFGRNELFPYSDIDLLFLCANEAAERDAHQAVRVMTQAIWDLGLRASPATRTIKECERFHPETQLEFATSLLDRRFLAGDASLAAQFTGRSLPSALLRDIAGLQTALAEAARSRHARFSDTIFHLEPNLKECPGGLRDAHLVHWLETFRQVASGSAWPQPPAGGSDRHPELRAAYEFLAATRCFLHFRSGRDENVLDWAAQDGAAAESVGLESIGSVDPAYWMRTYYRHARAIYRRAQLQMDGVAALARQPLLKSLRRKRALVPGTNFIVEQGRVTLGAGVATDSDGLLRVFGYIAQTGARFDEETESRILTSLTSVAIGLPEGPFLWNCLRDVLLGPHSAHALRLMHALGVLEMILPEFHGIDALVVRDAYHRYTVDEHTFLVIENVHALRTPHSEAERRFASLLPEIERRDLFLLALLLHDTGKARRTGDHARESIELAERVFSRLEFDLEERDMVRRIIRNHLEMSSALRRDIFDPESVGSFAGQIGGQQQLKMLTVLTYADIRAVHPDALTPWKAENIWQLYIAAANFLDRSVDESRYHVDADPVVLARIRSRVTVHGGFAQTGDENEQLRGFLEGLPQRYLQTRLPDQVGEHFRLAQALPEEPIQFAFRPHRQCNEITLITRDRPLLFADMAGALSAWGMNIVKADAFSNAAGVILDSFQFTDPFRTLELNPGEHERFLASLRQALNGQATVDGMLRARQRPRRGTARQTMRLRAMPRYQFDTESSSHSTLLQVVAPDSPGLLRSLAAAIAAAGCNIEVALVDTEGELAIDVFYLTVDRSKLDVAARRRVAGQVEEVLQMSGGQQPGAETAGAGITGGGMDGGEPAPQVSVRAL